MANIEPEVYQFLSMCSALKIQRDTGLRHSRGSVLKLLAERYGIEARTARKACLILEPIKELVVMRILEPAGKGRWRVELDFADDEGDPLVSARSFARDRGFEYELLEDRGPAGGWPRVRFTGERAAIFRVVAEYHE